MREALVVMNPRTIRACLDSFAALDIQQIYVQNMTEMQIMEEGYEQVMAIAASERFDWLWWTSDDVIVRRPALNALRALRRHGHEVVTGFCNLKHDDWRVNLCRRPLQGKTPVPNSYDWYSFHEIVGHQETTIRTHFAGMCLTGMPTTMWEKYPFGCYGGTGQDEGFTSDYSLSIRLQDDNVPIYTHRDSYCYHWKFNFHAMPPMTARDLKDFLAPLTLNFDEPRVVLGGQREATYA